MKLVKKDQKQKLFFPLLLLLSFNSNAQTKIIGTVVDENSQPLANANVLLLHSKDSSLIKGYVTAINGQYSFEELLMGNYIIATSYVGYKQKYTPVIDLNNNEDPLQLDAIRLNEKELQLSEVTVNTKKPLFEQKMDRLIVNVAGSITASGNTALEVLARSPGIIVDHQNNSISMNGKNGIVVMINGRISRMPLSAIFNMLAGMASGNIEKIELITTPPANFDAEGNAGYINIVLKTNTQYGTNGAYSIMGGFGKGLLSSGNINFNHRKAKWNLYGDASASLTNLEQPVDLYRKVMNDGNSVESNINTDRDAQITNVNGRLGLDYFASNKTILGILVSGNYNRWYMEARNRSRIFKNQLLDTIVQIDNEELHPTYNYTTNINLQQQLNENDKLNVNLDYVYTLDKNPTEYLNTYYNGNNQFLYQQQTKSNKKTPIQFWVGAADYTKTWNKKISMEAGIKGTFSEFTNNVNVAYKVGNNWVNDPSLTAIFYLKENIKAAYTSFSITMSEKSSAKVGLRYEYTNSNLNSERVKNIVDRHYGNFFPSFFFSHKINDTASFNFSYSRRITRPSFWDLAPFVIFMDPNTFFSGNPALQPSISDAVKGDYMFKKLIFSLSYTYESNPITNFAPKVDSVSNKQTLASENQKDRQTVALTFALPVTINNWWNMQNNVIGTVQKLNGIYNGEAFIIEQKGFNISSTQNFILPKNFSLECRGFYQSASIFGIYKVKAFSMVDLGVQKKFGAKGENLKFAISNIFGPPVFKLNTNLPEQNLVVRGNLQFVNTQFRLSYTRNFGNEKVTSKRVRSVASEEEQSRLAN